MQPITVLRQLLKIDFDIRESEANSNKIVKIDLEIWKFWHCEQQFLWVRAAIIITESRNYYDCKPQLLWLRATIIMTASRNHYECRPQLFSAFFFETSKIVHSPLSDRGSYSWRESKLLFLIPGGNFFSRGKAFWWWKFFPFSDTRIKLIGFTNIDSGPYQKSLVVHQAMDHFTFCALLIIGLLLNQACVIFLKVTAPLWISIPVNTWDMSSNFRPPPPYPEFWSF